MSIYRLIYPHMYVYLSNKVYIYSVSGRSLIKNNSCIKIITLVILGAAASGVRGEEGGGPIYVFFFVLSLIPLLLTFHVSKIACKKLMI